MVRIMVLDDVPDIRTSLRLGLQHAGYEVCEAADGEEGLALLAVRPVDVVIVDIFMPRKCGLETIQTIRREFPRTRIIAMSGGADEEGVDLLPLARRIGASAFVKKPFRPEELLEAIQETLAVERPVVFSKYRLTRRLGSGSMGDVFKAEHVDLGRTVAIKVMKPELLASPDAVGRFHREIQVAAALRHPNIVSVFDAGCFEGRYFLVMEYVEGRDLDRWVRASGPLAVNQASDFVRQAATGLQHAHERGVVHRDIKPSNLLVTRRSELEPYQVKILDMGLARFADPKETESELTRAGQMLGTPDYMAPEQAMHADRVTIRADIFSLGCTFYRLLTGETPYHGDSVIEKIMARTNHAAPRVRSLRPEVSTRLDSVVARMMARRPEHRFATPAAVIDAIDRINERSAVPVVA